LWPNQCCKCLTIGSPIGTSKQNSSGLAVEPPFKYRWQDSISRLHCLLPGGGA
jgi:hypothetical protein